MPASSKSQAFKLVFAHEGGYVNHPKDPGGATNLGVTQAVYDAWRKRRGKGKQSVRSITKSEATAIYDEQYWQKVQGDDLPAGLDYAVYDYAVNSGPSRAVKDLQRVLVARGRKLGVDGVMGNQTMVAIQAEMGKDEVGLITDYCRRRLAFMKSLKTWSTFGVGWSRRVMGSKDGYQKTDGGVIDFAIRMAIEDGEYGEGKVSIIQAKDLPASIGAKADEAPAKADEGDQAVTKTSVGIGTAIVAAGTGAQEIIPEVIEKLTPAADGSEHIANIVRALMIASVIIAAIFVMMRYKDKLSERSA